MKLSECLNHASGTTLKHIAVHLDLSCSLHSKNDMMQSIVFHAKSRQAMREVIAAWLRTWKDILPRLVVSGRKRFSQEEMKAMFHAAGLTEEDLQMALRQGWLFERSDLSHRSMFCIPDEVYDLIGEMVYEQLGEQIVKRADSPLIQRDEGKALVTDLQTFLDYVEHHDVKLTAEGAMYKRSVQQLMELFEITEELTVPEWRFGYGRRTHDYPDRLALLYDFAYDAGLVCELPEQTLMVTEKVSEWRETSQEIQLHRLVHYYLRVYRRPIPRLREIVNIVLRVAREWVQCDSVLSACGSFVREFYYDSREVVWRDRIVKMLVHLGLIRCGFDEDSSVMWFQMTKLGQELLTQDESSLLEEQKESQASLIVSPNFEIMVTVPSSAMEAVLAQFCDLKSSGAMRIYRILERTVLRGLSAGHDFEAWFRLLSQKSLGPIPGNVERLLHEWRDAYLKANQTLDAQPDDSAS